MCIVKDINKNLWWISKGRREESISNMILLLWLKCPQKEFTLFDEFEVIEELYVGLNAIWTSYQRPITHKLSKPPNVPFQLPYCLLFCGVTDET